MKLIFRVLIRIIAWSLVILLMVVYGILKSQEWLIIFLIKPINWLSAFANSLKSKRKI